MPTRTAVDVMENRAHGSRGEIDVVVGLGANLGAPRGTLRTAVGWLSEMAEVTAVSALYESLPVGGPPQPRFLNAAVRMRWSGSVGQLLGALLELERRAGRERRVRWGPRTLDLDILWGAGIRSDSPTLQIPHPRLRERAFALLPLLDVAPDSRDPLDGVKYSDIQALLGGDGVRVLAGTWLGEAGGRLAVRGMDSLGS